ncbi:hypothetical protein K7432_001079 [Basidiobolus ranarum]|uniref:SLS1 N-terminal domain-containing protein n=1 Tax=Basidiobolus ranarum TaxID=34480 RepID=A0ABR2X3L7_9FUNG
MHGNIARILTSHARSLVRAQVNTPWYKVYSATSVRKYSAFINGGDKTEEVKVTTSTDSSSGEEKEPSKGDKKSATKAKSKKAKRVVPPRSEIVDKLMIDLIEVPRESTIDDINNAKPLNLKLTEEEHQIFQNRFDKSFTSTQLKEYCKTYGINSGKSKSHTIEKIMKYWNIEKVKALSGIEIAESIIKNARNEDNFTEVFDSNRRDLFFIIGHDGDTIRQLELEGNVVIGIDLENERYTIKGQDASVDKIKYRIKQMLNYVEETLDIEDTSSEEFLTKNLPVISEISKLSNTYMVVDDDKKLHISGLSDSDLRRARLLLSSVWSKPDEHHSSGLFYHGPAGSKPILNFFPLHDPQSMSLYHKSLNCFRVGPAVSSAVKEGSARLEDATAHIAGDDPASSVRKAEFADKLLNTDVDASQIDFRARFGHVMFFDKYLLNQPGLFTAPRIESMCQEQLKQWLDKSKYNWSFFPSYPASSLSKGLVPITRKQFYEVDYKPANQVYKNITGGSVSSIRALFQILTDQIELENVLKVTSRKSADIIVPEGKADVQFRATAYHELSSPNVYDELKRHLDSSASSLCCPKDLLLETSSAKFNLAEVTLRSSNIYDYNGLTLLIDHIARQNSGEIRTEVSVSTDTPHVMCIEREANLCLLS